MGRLTAQESPIAVGRTAEVYRWDSGWILKLFRPPWSTPASVDQEARVARAVHAVGLPVPAVGNVVEIDGRLGLMYERVEGPTMLQLLTGRPWNLRRYGRLLADLHAKVHACRTPALPSQHERLAHRIRIAEGLAQEHRQALLAELGRLSAEDQLCHGDFHPENILMTARGPVIIDWRDATRGSPSGDVARTSLLLSIGFARESTFKHRLMRIGWDWLHQTYLTRYVDTHAAANGRLTAWRPIVAAARLSEHVAGEREPLMRVVRTGSGARS